jgi:ABC-type polysaccharide/polyol phosphate transport system ATPase subunit
MSLRLSFAIAMSVLPDMLVLDEMLTTGDASFAVRAKARMQAIVDALEILVIATHDVNTARNLCNRGLVLSQGRIVADAPIEDALEAYEALDQAVVAAG